MVASDKEVDACIEALSNLSLAKPRAGAHELSTPRVDMLGREPSESIVDFDGYVKKLSAEFTDEERDWFVDSFALHMQHRSDPEAFVISIDNVMSWLAFTRRDSAVRLLQNNFVENEDFTTASLSSGAVHMGGGHNKVDYMLNVHTFKEMCMISNTTESKTVRRYYIKMEKILMEHMASERDNALAAAAHDKETAISETFVNQQRQRNVFYIAKMESLGDDDHIYKIGSTGDVEDRQNSMRRVFGSTPIFKEVVATDMHKELETAMLEHNSFKDKKYDEPVNGIHKSRECFRGSEADFEVVRDIARKRASIMGSIDRMSALEFANIKLQETDLRIKEIDARVREAEIPMKEARGALAAIVGELARKSFADPHNASLKDQYDRALQGLTALSDVETSTGTPNTPVDPSPASNCVFASATPKVDVRHGRPVQRYNSQTLQFIDSFQAIAMAIHACGDDNSGSPSGMKKAIEGNHIYLGYRWAFVAKDADRDTPVTIPATVQARSSRPGLVAKMHPTLNIVVYVYTNQKEAGEQEGLKSSQTITLAIHDKHKKARGHRWMYWANVDFEAQEAYMKKNALPEEFGRSGRRVRQMDALTHDEIHVHKSIGAVCKKFKVGSQTVKDACKDGHKVKGFAWEWVE